jgi:hypothetical protein
MNIQDIINNIAAGENLVAREGLENALSAKAFDALQDRKQEIASALYAGQDETSEDDAETEEEGAYSESVDYDVPLTEEQIDQFYSEFDQLSEEQFDEFCSDFGIETQEQLDEISVQLAHKWLKSKKGGMKYRTKENKNMSKYPNKKTMEKHMRSTTRALERSGAAAQPDYYSKKNTINKGKYQGKVLRFRKTDIRTIK